MQITRRGWLALAPAAVAAAEWTQWRGPQRSGLAEDVSLPQSWPAELRRLWRVEVGEGHSSPVVSGDRIFAFSREGDRETLRALQLSDGKELWKQSYAAPYEMNSAARAHGEGPKSTPLIHEGRLYTLGISGILSCWQAATGELLWRKEFAERFRTTSPLYGAALSPVAAGGLLFVHVGGHDDGALLALEPEGGEERWSWTADGPGYASPIIAELAGFQQVITLTQGTAVGLDAPSGRALWRVPLETPYDQNAVTPVVSENLVILSGYQGRTFAVRIIKKTGTPTAEEVWSNDEVPMYMSSPVVRGGFLYGFTHKRRGALFCLGAKTGELQWIGDGRAGDNASLTIAGEWLLALNTDGAVSIVRPNPERLDVVKEYEVADSPVWASPALTEQSLLVKDFDGLTRWSWG